MKKRNMWPEYEKNVGSACYLCLDDSFVSEIIFFFLFWAKLPPNNAMRIIHIFCNLLVSIMPIHDYN